MGPFRAVNKIQFYLLSLIWLRQYWLLPTADLYPKAEMAPGWAGVAFWLTFFGLNCAQIALEGAESDFGLQGIGTLGLKQIFLIFSVQGVSKIQVSQSENRGLLQTKQKGYW